MNVFDKVANAKIKSSLNWIKVGTHKLALKDYKVVQTQSSGTVLGAEFVVLESTAHKKGEVVNASWGISKPGWQGENELGRAKAFVAALLGTTDDDQIRSGGAELASEAQPGRGMLVLARGIPTKTDYVNVAWEHLDQKVEDIRARRVEIESGGFESAEAPQESAPAQETKSVLGSLFNS